jgi:hypothetical protein
MANGAGRILGAGPRRPAPEDSDTPTDDDSYLVHPNPRGSELSEGQRRVLLHNPYVRAP